METLGEYFSHHKDYYNMSQVYSKLYQKLKKTHEEGKVVPFLHSSSIYVGDDVFFGGTAASYSLEEDKRDNLVTLTKLFLGTFLSLEAGFRDFSSLDTYWLSENLEDVLSNISADNFTPDYFREVLLDGKNLYYHEYLQKLQQESSSLSSQEQSLGRQKVLSNAGSKLYQDSKGENSTISENENFSLQEGNSRTKNSTGDFISFMFYPFLLLSSLAMFYSVYSGLTTFLLGR